MLFPQPVQGLGCCFSGHRKLDGVYMTPQTHPMIYNKMLEIIYRAHVFAGVTEFVSGGALGIDQMAALAVLQLQFSYPDVYLGMAIPFPGFEGKWRAESKKMLADLCQAARWVHMVHTDTPTEYGKVAGYLEDRNRWMSDNCHYAVVFIKQIPMKGGTYNFVKYRRRKKMAMKIIDVAHSLSPVEHGWEVGT